MTRLLLILFAFALSSCEGQVNTAPDEPYQSTHPSEFGDYWYAGKAELNRYELKQSRYGQQREGEVVMIFVTEDFLPEEQVKKEFGDQPSVKVLKLNYLKKFVTGIYDYSVMTSVFTPVEFQKNPATLKVSFSSQDWCGQTFSQINLREATLNYQMRSYFQAEGDENLDIPATYLEDDLWNRMRLEPQTLPLGKIEMVPSQEFLRLKHHPFEAYKAEASLFLQVNDSKSREEFYVYSLKYPDLKRELKVRCQSRFPFKVLGWEETWDKGSDNAQVTTAQLTQTLLEPYWEQNSNKHQTLRDSLGLEYEIR